MPSSLFVKHISLPLIMKRDGLNHFNRNLNDLNKSQFWSSDDLLTSQFDRLKKLLIHAYENTNYYKDCFDEFAFSPYSFKFGDGLSNIPLLSKNIIRDNLDRIVAKNIDKSNLHSAETGGTTGVKMEFYRDNACLSQKEAALYRFDQWTGWDLGEHMGIVWTAQQDYIGHWTLKSKIKNELTFKQVVFPAAIITEELIENYIRLLISKRPTMIRAFVSPLYEVAKYIRDKGIETIRLKGITTTGEPLYAHQRKAISEAFQCDVFDSYRSRETGPLAQECEYHNGMHINAESLFIEIVPPTEKGSLEDGLGEIVVTDLLNYGMPLIRYKMGDVGMLSSESCACGRGLPILKKISGRTADLLYTPEGKRITAGSLVLYLVDEAPGLLGQVQLIQDRLDHLTIKMTKDPSPSQEILDYQKSTVKRLFGNKMHLSFKLVDKIPSEKSGKYRFTICKLTEKDLKL